MTNDMDEFFGLATASGQTALLKEREKLDMEIKNELREQSMKRLLPVCISIRQTPYTQS